MGAARSGNPDAAKADIAKLAELRDKLREAKDAYWAEQVDIQRQVATAFLLEAEGKPDDALKAMSAAADAEDKTEKSPVTPGVPQPARELYGIMLLERGMAREALAAFEATIKKEPNRFNAIAGAAKAAERLGATRRKPRTTTRSSRRSRAMPIPSGPTSRRRARSWPRTERSHRRAAPTGKVAVSTHRMLVICDPGQGASLPAHATLNTSVRSDLISIRIDEVRRRPGTSSSCWRRSLRSWRSHRRCRMA